MRDEPQNLQPAPARSGRVSLPADRAVKGGKASLRFTLRQLSYFVAAGETGSVTRAAAQVNVSQPSISAAISHLETEFGVQLFVRHHAQGLSLTPAGRRLMRAAREPLRSAYGLYEVANAAVSSISGPLNVGSFRTLAPLMVPELWKGFVTRNPEVEMRVTEGSEAEMIEGLRTARLDIALTYSLSLTADLSFQPLAKLPSYVLLPPTHSLAGRGSLSLADLRDEPFILLDLPLSRQYFLSIFESAGIIPRIVAETPDPSALRSYVAAGIGFSILTARPRNTFAENGLPLSYLELEGNHPTAVVGLATLTELQRPRIVDAFAEYCSAVVADGGIPGMLPSGV